MKRQALLFVLVVVAQLVALGVMVAKREHLLRTGELVRLRCRPVDPRSLLSGDYVELTYVIAELGGPVLQKLPLGEELRRGETIYVALARAPGEDFHHAVAVSRDRHRLRGLGVPIRGRLIWATSDSLQVRYGVEHYFVPQREGLRIEGKMGDTVVEVAVSRSTGESGIRRLFIGGQEVGFY